MAYNKRDFCLIGQSNLEFHWLIHSNRGTGRRLPGLSHIDGCFSLSSFLFGEERTIRNHGKGWGGGVKILLWVNFFLVQIVCMNFFFSRESCARFFFGSTSFNVKEMQSFQHFLKCCN